MPRKKKLPIGIQSFSRMVEGNFIYVDKTKNILEIIEMGDCFFLSRPRRFGKSLLLSTFKEIFSGNKTLFSNLYVAKTNYDWKVHPVVSLSFTSNVETAESLKKDIEWRLLDCAREYGLDISDAPSLQTKLIALIKRLAVHGRVVILIDEYDYPLINNMNNFALADECRKLLHDFFIVLKELGEYIRFIFITGVTKFSKTSIFSGLNNLHDISLSPITAPLLGYTEQELATFFDEYIDLNAVKNQDSKANLLAQLKVWYDGYQFTESSASSSEKMYNPFSILLFLSSGKILNYWADTGTPHFLAHLISSQRYPLAQIDGAEVNFEETKSYDIDGIKLIPLLWQTGYLTLDSYDAKTQNYRLTYPNQEVKISFLNYFFEHLTDTPIAVIKNFVIDFQRALEKEDLKAFFDTFEIFLANVSYTIQLPLEKYYQTIFYIVMSLIGSEPKVEEATNDGRIDAVLEGPNILYIFEFKLNASAEDAIKQIEDKRYYQKYVGKKKTIMLVGASFSTEKRNLLEWVSKTV